MNRVEEIIKRCRYLLADMDGDRWNDERLLMLLDEGQKLIVRKTNFLRSTSLFEIDENNNKVKLPDDFQALDTILYADSPLSVTDSYTADNEIKGWETNIGNPQFAIVDMTDKGQLYVTPRPSGTNELIVDFGLGNETLKYDSEYTKPTGKILRSDALNTLPEGFFGVLFALEGSDKEDFGFMFSPCFSVDEDYGFCMFHYPLLYGVTLLGQEDFGFNSIGENYGLINSWDIQSVDNFTTTTTVGQGVLTNFNTDSKYGMVTNINDEGDLYGFVTSAKETKMPELKVRYYRKPKDIKSKEDTLELDSSADLALKYYIVAMCLRDDMDAQNRAAGNEYLQLFTAELKDNFVEASKHFLGTSRYYDLQVKYFSGF